METKRPRVSFTAQGVFPNCKGLMNRARIIYGFTVELGCQQGLSLLAFEEMTQKGYSPL